MGCGASTAAYEPAEAPASKAFAADEASPEGNVHPDGVAPTRALTAEEAQQRARQALKEGRFEDAAAAIAQVQAGRPRHVPSMYVVGSSEGGAPLAEASAVGPEQSLVGRRSVDQQLQEAAAAREAERAVAELKLAGAY